MKKFISFIFCFILLCAPLTAYANSAQTSWAGRDSRGALVTDENCPLTVEKELLTLDIQQFPDMSLSQDELNAYTPSVTAQYTFNNPSDYDVEATLVFPFGKLPNYINIYTDENHSIKNILPDKEKYSIKLDGQEIEKQLRFTYSPGEFEINTEMPKIIDGYIEDDFYTPQMPVTKYVYKAYGWNTEEEKFADAGFVWKNETDETALLFSYYNSFRRLSDTSAMVTVSVRENEEFELYLIGKQPRDPPLLKCWTGSSSKGFTEMEGTVELVSHNTMTFEEFILNEWEQWEKQSNISKTDWYNIFVTAFNKYEMGSMRIIDNYADYYNLCEDIIAWYKYDISVPAGQSVVNAVTAPLYPGSNYRYEPPLFDYTYYLSPAATWADFGEIEININTPFYITDCAISGFEKTESGYVYKAGTLPQGELQFTMSESQTPKKAENPYKWYMFGILSPVIIGIPLCIFGFVWMIKKDKK